MDDVLIPKDFKEYAPKLIAGLSIRQTLITFPAVVLAVFAKSALPDESFIPAMFFIFFLVWIFGWTKPYNMKFEDFFATSFVKMYLSPQTRKYISVNLYREINDKPNLKNKNRRNKKNGKENKKN